MSSVIPDSNVSAMNILSTSRKRKKPERLVDSEEWQASYEKIALEDVPDSELHAAIVDENFNEDIPYSDDDDSSEDDNKICTEEDLDFIEDGQYITESDDDFQEKDVKLDDATTDDDEEETEGDNVDDDEEDDDNEEFDMSTTDDDELIL